MKKILFVCILLILSTSTIFAQWQWVKKGCRTDDNNGVYTHDVAVDASNNGIYCGYYCGTSADQVTFDGSTLNGYGAAFHYSGFIAKYNSSGTVQWLERIGSSDDGFVEIKGIITDASGNIYICGYFERITHFGDADPLAVNKTSVYSGDGFIAKYTSAGVFQWVSVIAAAPTPQGSKSVEGIRISNNAIYVVGTYSAKIDFGGGINLTSTLDGAFYSNDIFVAKYDLNGTCLWAQSAGGNKTDYGYGIAIDPSENIFIAGIFQSTATFGSYNITTGAGAGSTNANSYLAKYNSSGTCQWVKQGYSISSLWNSHYQIAIDNNNDLYLAGFLSAGTSISFGTTVTNSGAVNSIFVTKITNAGVHSWTQQFTATGASMDANGLSAYGSSVFVSGNFNGTATFGGYPQTSTGADDFYLAKLSQSTGLAEESAKAGGPSCDGYYSFLANDSNGDLLIGGSSWGVGSTMTFGTLTIGLVRNTGFIAKMLFCVSSTDPTSASASASPVCSGGASTLSVSGGSLGSGASWYWYTGGCGGTLAGTGATLVVNPTSTTTYWVLAQGTCGTTNCVSTVVTVSPNASIASVTGSSPICIGATTTYTANSVVLGGGTGAWSSSNSGIASVNSSGVVTGISAGTCNIIYTITGGCGGTVSAQQGITITPNASIASVSGTSPICIGATATYTANSVVLGGGTGSWSSSNSGIASVNSSGVVTGVSAGICNIIYTITGGCGGTVSAQQGITITPNASVASVSGTSPVCIGATPTYTANSVVLGGGTGTWSSSAGYAFVNPSTGAVTALSAGTCDIIYTITGGCGGTVSAQQSITVNPNASIGSVSGASPICAGATTTYTANSVVLGGGTGAWSSNNTGIATVNSSGVVTGVSGGTCNIIYTITGGCGGTPAAQQSITITPNASVASVSGTSPVCIGTTPTYTANSVVLSGGTGAWSSSDNGIATVNSSGVVTPVAAGLCNIIYTITGGCGGTVSVQQSITITPNASVASVSGASSVCIGTTPTYTANSVVLGGGTGTWSSSNTGIATVNSSTGVVTPVAAGSCDIIYTVTGGCGGNPTAQQSITITPNASVASVAGASPICAAATATYTANSVVLGGGTGSWSSSNISYATVDPATGVVTGVAAGTCNIIYIITGGCGSPVSAQQSITVNTESVAPTSISESINNICSGTTVTLTLSGGSLGTGASWYWYSDGCGTTLIGSGTTTLNVTPSATTTYFVRAEGTCNTTSCAQVTITVNTGSTAPTSITASQTSVCSGTSVDLTLVGGSLGSGASWEWYTGSCGGTSLASGVTSVTVTPAVTTTYFVRAEETCGNTVCASTTITVNDPSVAPAAINASETTVCSGTGINLTVSGGTLGTGASWEWYSATCGGTSEGTGLSITVYPTVSTSYFVRAEGTCNTTTCALIDITVKDSSYEATSISISPNPICSNGSTTLTLSGGSLGTNATWHWYETGCGGVPAGTGTSVVVSPATTTTYLVRAEGECNITNCISTQVTVIPAPDPGQDASASVCASESNVYLIDHLGGTPDAGGIWLDPLNVPVTQPIDAGSALQGIYHYIVSGTNPCLSDTSELDLTIIEAPSLDSVIITPNTMCNAPYDGEAEFQASGAGGGYDYVVDGGLSQTSPLFTGLQAGSHTYSITGANGCTTTGNFIMTSNTGFVIDSIFTNNISCYGNTNGSITIYAQGAVSYSIDNGANYVLTNSFTGLNPGIYPIIVVNSGNCQAVQIVSLYEPPALMTDTLVSPAVCGPSGYAQVICYGGTPAYSYQWNTGSTSQIITGQAPGTYYVTVTDQNECSITTSAIIGFTPGTGSASVIDYSHIACNGESNGYIEVAMNFGIGPYTYTWLHDANLDTAIADSLPAGTYYVTITDTYSCVATTSFTITEPPVLSATYNINDATCGPTGFISVTTTGGTSPYTFNWSNGGNTNNITSLSSGFYFLTITDNHGCQILLDSLEVEELGGSGSALVTNLVDISCQGQTDGSITVSMPLGFPPITYNWSHDTILNSPTAPDLGPGQYYVTITDSYGCSAIVNGVITEPGALGGSYLSLQILCNGTASGGVDLTIYGGTLPYFYEWSNLVTTEDISGVPTGYYSVTVTDNHGCSWAASNILVRDISVIILDQDISHIPCNSSSTGQVVTTAIGGQSPYSILWSDGDTLFTNTGLLAGTYYCTVTDYNGCYISDTITILQAPALSGNISAVHLECYNNPTGVVTVSQVNGGIPPYTYTWNHASSLNDTIATNLLSGMYYVTINDTFGCELVLHKEVYNSAKICLIIPDLFTPNGDGVNETFEIKGIEAFPEAIMMIYNRWGDMIFKSTFCNDFWDGTWKGEPMPMGAYVFILDLRNDEEPIQGVVTIVY